MKRLQIDPGHLPIMKHKVLTKDEEREISKQIKKGNKKAADQLIDNNYKLVWYIASRYKARGIPFEDLIQHGIIGLIKAARRFDHTKNAKFSTYAAFWIKQGIMLAIYNESTLITAPIYLKLLWSRLKYAKRLNLTPQQEKTILRCSEVSYQRVLKLNAIEIEGNFQLDSIDTTPASTIEYLELKQAIKKLKQREQDIIIRRFYEEQTLQKIGDDYKITRESVRIIILKAIEHLRQFLTGVSNDNNRTNKIT